MGQICCVSFTIDCIYNVLLIHEAHTFNNINGLFLHKIYMYMKEICETYLWKMWNTYIFIYHLYVYVSSGKIREPGGMLHVTLDVNCVSSLALKNCYSVVIYFICCVVFWWKQCWNGTRKSGSQSYFWHQIIVTPWRWLYGSPEILLQSWYFIHF